MKDEDPIQPTQELIECCRSISDVSLQCKELPDCVALSVEARDLVEASKAKANEACLGEVWAASAPAECPLVATCGMLVIVDASVRNGVDAKLRDEIRHCYDNKGCLRVCSLNVLNPGYVPLASIADDGSRHGRSSSSSD